MVWAKDAATDGGATLTYVTYKYDALGNRIEEDVWTSGTGTVMTDYAYDGQNVWADTSSSLQMRRLYSNAVDAVLARIDGSGNAAWYLTDRQGSVRDIDKADGTAVLDHLDYDGWGNVTYESNSANGDRYKWTGREWDAAVSLQYNRARYYDPATGRWTSQDPLGFDAGDSNLYRYVKNAPTDASDPSGKNVYLLIKPNNSVLTGHAAVLVGPIKDNIGKDTWEYYSFTPKSLFPNWQGLFTPYYPYKVFRSVDAVVMFLEKEGYKEVIWFETTAKQDALERFAFASPTIRL
jgi:RHS repeat-associated protein